MRRSPILCSGGARSRRHVRGHAAAWPKASSALLALTCTFAGTLAHAETPPPPAGAEALAAARTAWDGRHFAAAELSYKSALDHGGLAPADTLDAYVHLGAARAALGKRELARAAFRQAALIDRYFKTPRGASKRATLIASLARRDEAKLGSIVLNAVIPQSVPAGESFGIDATLDPKHAAITAKVGVDARDSLSGKHWATSDVAAAEMHFDIPANVTLPGATLVVRIDALDPHDNRLASREQRVRVEARETPAIADLPAKPAPVAAPAALTFTADVGTPSKLTRDKGEKHGGILSSPWFYLVGGVVLAAGGAFAYYELRPSDDVSLGGARVVTR
ncbi:MAG: hypothetical protein ACLQBL_32320 [Polyangiaceae bacterium]